MDNEITDRLDQLVHKLRIMTDSNIKLCLGLQQFAEKHPEHAEEIRELLK